MRKLSDTLSAHALTMAGPTRTLRWGAAALLMLLALRAQAQHPAVYGAADPIVKDESRFDPKRPIAHELQTDVPDGFSVGAVGDLIISRPLSLYASRLPEFKAALDILHGTDVLYGNLETRYSMRAISPARPIRGTGTGPTRACRPSPRI